MVQRMKKFEGRRIRSVRSFRGCCACLGCGGNTQFICLVLVRYQCVLHWKLVRILLEIIYQRFREKGKTYVGSEHLISWVCRGGPRLRPSEVVKRKFQMKVIEELWR